jgi:hypothetical protein
MDLEPTGFCAFLMCYKKQMTGPEDGVNNRRKASEQRVSSTKRVPPLLLANKSDNYFINALIII